MAIAFAEGRRVLKDDGLGCVVFGAPGQAWPIL
jgi:hypothetical protein